MLTSGLHIVCMDTGTPTPQPLLSKLKLCTVMYQCVTVAVTKRYRLKQQQCEREKRERCGLPKDSFRCLFSIHHKAFSICVHVQSFSLCKDTRNTGFKLALMASFYFFKIYFHLSLHIEVCEYMPCVCMCVRVCSHACSHLTQFNRIILIKTVKPITF